MQVAMVVTKEEPKILRRLSAEQYAAASGKDAAFKARTEAFDIDTLAPVHFRREHYRYGMEEHVSACFAFAAGHAPSEDHIFGHKRESMSVVEAVQNRKIILFSLNADLTNCPEVDYRRMERDPLTTSIEEWMAAYRGKYFFQGIRAAEDLVRILRTLHAEVPGFKPSVSVKILHRGGVMEYSQFFVHARPGDLQQLYHTMQDGITGMSAGDTKTRIIGFPRLMEFALAETTRTQKGTRGIRSTSYPDGQSSRIFNQLIMRDHDQDPHILKHEWDKVSGMGPRFFVLAAPVISPASSRSLPARLSRKPNWEQIRWIVNNMDTQFAKKAQPSVQQAPPRRDPAGTGDLFSSPAAAA